MADGRYLILKKNIAISPHWFQLSILRQRQSPARVGLVKQ